MKALSTFAAMTFEITLGAVMALATSVSVSAQDVTLICRPAKPCVGQLCEIEIKLDLGKADENEVLELDLRSLAGHPQIDWTVSSKDWFDTELNVLQEDMPGTKSSGLIRDSRERPFRFESGDVTGQWSRTLSFRPSLGRGDLTVRLPWVSGGIRREAGLQVPITEVPKAGMPASYSGGIGLFRVELVGPDEIERSNVVFDIRLRIRGDAPQSFGAVPLEGQRGWADFSVEDQVQIEDTSSFRDIIYHIRSLRGSISRVPGVEVSSYDPRSRRFQTLRTGAHPLSVANVVLASPGGESAGSMQKSLRSQIESVPPLWDQPHDWPLRLWLQCALLMCMIVAGPQLALRWFYVRNRPTEKVHGRDGGVLSRLCCVLNRNDVATFDKQDLDQAIRSLDGRHDQSAELGRKLWRVLSWSCEVRYAEHPSTAALSEREEMVNEVRDLEREMLRASPSANPLIGAVGTIATLVLMVMCVAGLAGGIVAEPPDFRLQHDAADELAGTEPSAHPDLPNRLLSAASTYEALVQTGSNTSSVLRNYASSLNRLGFESKARFYLALSTRRSMRTIQSIVAVVVAFTVCLLIALRLSDRLMLTLLCSSIGAVAIVMGIAISWQLEPSHIGSQVAAKDQSVLFRSGPGLSYDQIRVERPKLGEPLQVTAKIGEWVKVRIGQGELAWVHHHDVYE